MLPLYGGGGGAMGDVRLGSVRFVCGVSCAVDDGRGDRETLLEDIVIAFKGPLPVLWFAWTATALRPPQSESH